MLQQVALPTVVDVVMQINARRSEQATGTAYVVPRPRDSDAIGEALRSAYAGHRAHLPTELRDALDRLDRAG